MTQKTSCKKLTNEFRKTTDIVEKSLFVTMKALELVLSDKWHSKCKSCPPQNKICVGKIPTGEVCINYQMDKYINLAEMSMRK